MQTFMKQLKLYFIVLLFPAVHVCGQSDGTDLLSIIETDSLPIQKLMYLPKIDTVSTWIRNRSETDSLFYRASIEYKRTAKEVSIQDTMQLQLLENQAFNQYINYVDSAYLSAAYGNPDQSPVKIAIRFNADSAGFNLSNIGTWFIAEQDTSDIIQVEIRAGGHSIQDAIVVSQGVARYEISKSELNGHFYNVALEKPVAMYPNEDFYVVFTYPAGIYRPQGCAINDVFLAVEGRYWVEKDGQFVDLQQLEGYSNAAWLISVAEKSPENIAWLNFVSNPIDAIQAKDSTLFHLQLNGPIAGLGSQYADIVIHSNDTINPVVKIPVHLRLNEAPYFLDAPSDLFVAEGSVLTITIQMEDYEQDAFSIVPVMGCKFVQFSATDSVMTLKISPTKGDKGDYVIKYNAVDEYGLVRELKITIHVQENQAPYFIDPPAEITVTEGNSLELTIEVKDEEEDDFEIRLVSEHDFVRSAFETPAITLYFSPQVGDGGDYDLRLLAIDAVGSTQKLTIPVHVLYKNRPPVCLKEGEPFAFSFMDEAVKFDINAYFMDLDGDSFSFEIFCHNSNIVEVSINDESHFTLKPRSVGGTMLDFTLTDARGERAQYSLNVIVGLCEDPSRIIVQKWNKVLLVNNSLGEYVPEGFQWYKNGQPIKNATLQYYSSEDDTGGLLDASAEYFVRIVKLNGDTIYTCPCVPGQNTVALRAYPNPVARGQNLNFEIDSTDFDFGTAQVIDISGNIIKAVQVDKNNTTVQMPEAPGFYVIRIVFGDRKAIFRVKVK
jgi:hypothetical protein